MHEIDKKLKKKLEERATQGNLRQLKTSSGLLDFCSNDYLGLARSEKLRALIQEEEEKHKNLPLGATGSRLLSGNHTLFEELEGIIAQYHQGEAALLFNSGYTANVGLLSTIPQRGDTVFYDEYCHASMKDGLRLCHAKCYSFRHNNLLDLEKKLEHATGQIFIVVESVYSMDGDQAPLVKLANLCEKLQAALIVDEAHAVGIYGPKGEGLTIALGLADKVFAQVVTYGKALGSHGAAIVGSRVLREYLVNFCRPFIYTTSLPTHALITLKCVYKLLPDLDKERESLKNNARYLFARLNSISGISCTPSGSVILSVVLTEGGIAELKQLAIDLQEQGFDVRPVLSPTVPIGQERLRVIVHAFNKKEEIEGLVKAIAKGK